MKKENRKIIKALLLITQLGMNILVTVFLCVWFGRFLDQKLNTQVWFIVFLILGLLAAYRNAYVMTKAFYAKDKSREEKQQEYFDSLTREREAKRK